MNRIALTLWGACLLTALPAAHAAGLLAPMAGPPLGLADAYRGPVAVTLEVDGETRCEGEGVAHVLLADADGQEARALVRVDSECARQSGDYGAEGSFEEGWRLYDPYVSFCCSASGDLGPSGPAVAFSLQTWYFDETTGIGTTTTAHGTLRPVLACATPCEG